MVAKDVDPAAREEARHRHGTSEGKFNIEMLHHKTFKSVRIQFGGGKRWYGR